MKFDENYGRIQLLFLLDATEGQPEGPSAIISWNSSTYFVFQQNWARTYLKNMSIKKLFDQRENFT